MPAPLPTAAAVPPTTAPVLRERGLSRAGRPDPQGQRGRRDLGDRLYDAGLVASGGKVSPRSHNGTLFLPHLGCLQRPRIYEGPAHSPVGAAQGASRGGHVGPARPPLRSQPGAGRDLAAGPQVAPRVSPPLRPLPGRWPGRGQAEAERRREPPPSAPGGVSPAP